MFGAAVFVFLKKIDITCLGSNSIVIGFKYLKWLSFSFKI